VGQLAGGVVQAADQLAFLEVVDQCHHPVRVQAERLADGPLGLALADQQSVQQPEVAGSMPSGSRPSASSPTTAEPRRDSMKVAASGPVSGEAAVALRSLSGLIG
jgi:hypothetical protein